MITKVRKLLDLTMNLFQTDLNKAEELAKEAIEYSREHDCNDGLVESLVIYCRILSDKGVTENITDHLDEAFLIAKGLDNKTLLLKVYVGLGIYYLNTGALDHSFSCYMSSLKLSNEIGDEDSKPDILSSIATVLLYKESYKDSLDYFFNAKEAAEKSNNVITYIKILNNIGCIYNLLEELDKAEEYINKAILESRKENFTYILSPALDELGTIYSKRKDFKRAVDCWEESIQVDKNRGGSFSSTAPRINLAEYYISVNNLECASKYLDRAIELCLQTNNNTDLVKAYELKTKFHEGKKNFEKALYYYKEFYRLDRDLKTKEAVLKFNDFKLEAITKSRDRLEALGKIGREITESLDMATIFDRLYSSLQGILDCDAIGIAKYNEDSGEIEYELFKMNGKDLPSVTKSVGEENCIASYVIRNNEPVIIQDYINEYSKYIKNQYVETTDSWNISEDVPISALFYPLKVGRKIIGLITVQSLKKDAYSIDDIDAFDILASYISIAFNNAIQSKKIMEQNKELSILATSDSLTGLKNRRAFFEHINKCYSWSTRINTPLSLIILDLDYFKKVNDSYGHPVGDKCLIEVSKILKNSIKRGSDEVARLGGEEFGVILGDTDLDGAFTVAEDIRKKIENLEIEHQDVIIKITSSQGVSTLDGGDTIYKTVEDLIAASDRALYVAKDCGRNCTKTSLDL